MFCSTSSTCLNQKTSQHLQVVLNTAAKLLMKTNPDSKRLLAQFWPRLTTFFWPSSGLQLRSLSGPDLLARNGLHLGLNMATSQPTTQIGWFESIRVSNPFW